MKILIKDGIVIDMVNKKPEIKDILISEDRIEKIGYKIEENADKIINAENKVIMPGLVNCHNHCAMSIFRGHSDDLELQEWLNNAIWPVEEKLTKEEIYYASLLSCIEMIKTGTTTFHDMYFLMEDVAKAVEESGIRALISRTVVTEEEPRTRLKEAEELYLKYNKKANGRILVNVSLHAPYTCDERTIKKCVELAKKYKMSIHIHLSETEKENKDIKEKYGITPTEYLKKNGVFEVKTILAHCVYLSSNDINIIKKENTGIAHNPISNLKLSSGMANIVKYKENGITVGIGTDGAGSTNTLDMFEEMKVSAYIQKVLNKKSSCINAEDILKMATTDGAKVLGLDKEIGSIEEGKKADIIIINIEKPHIKPINNIYSALVYSAVGQDVETSIVDGKIIMENREIIGIDEKMIMDKCQKISDKYFR